MYSLHLKTSLQLNQTLVLYQQKLGLSRALLERWRKNCIKPLCTRDFEVSHSHNTIITATWFIKNLYVHMKAKPTCIIIELSFNHNPTHWCIKHCDGRLAVMTGDLQREGDTDPESVWEEEEYDVKIGRERQGVTWNEKRREECVTVKQCEWPCDDKQNLDNIGGENWWVAKNQDTLHPNSPTGASCCPEADDCGHPGNSHV